MGIMITYHRYNIGYNNLVNDAHRNVDVLIHGKYGNLHLTKNLSLCLRLSLPVTCSLSFS